MQSSSNRSSNRSHASYRPLQHQSRASSPAPPYDDYTRQTGLRLLPSMTSPPPGVVSGNPLPLPPRHDTSTAMSITNITEGHPSSRLPFFEAALARTRGATSLGVPPQQIQQPLPIYFPPVDPNHPRLEISMIPAQTIRAARPNVVQGRGLSRSPTPEHEPTYVSHSQRDTGQSYLDDYEALDGDHWDRDEKGFDDTGDISQIPYSAMSTRHIQHPSEPFHDCEEDSHKLESTTRHFGPAPTHRVHRRTHNAAGHRRIKQTAMLDENGFFAVDMPIPTRLTQFLPFKGVEEQKSTR